MKNLGYVGFALALAACASSSGQRGTDAGFAVDGSVGDSAAPLDAAGMSDSASNGDGGDVCAQIATKDTCSGDGFSVATCEASADAATACSSQFTALLSCYLGAPLVCDSTNGSGYLSDSSAVDTGTCAGQFNAYASCAAGGPGDSGAD